MLATWCVYCTNVDRRHVSAGVVPETTRSPADSCTNVRIVMNELVTEIVTTVKNVEID